LYLLESIGTVEREGDSYHVLSELLSEVG
jgi:hypothetical protein